MIANHTFVFVDTVSLSAKGQIDPASGSQEMPGGLTASKDIWDPTDQFLHQARATKARAIRRSLQIQNHLPENEPMDHTIFEFDEPGARKIFPEPQVDVDIPSVLLTHVPLYRSAGTPCGPLRERYPPSNSGASVEKDERNALKIQAGYQYQNVLTSTISDEVIDLVGNVTHVFSGDDHDYCDIIHREYPSSGVGGAGGGIREITVKSISWAMGVRKPGFLLVSLWNPVDEHGKTLPTPKGGGGGKRESTLQTHLCLLPDQLQIFIRYAQLLVVTLAVLSVHAVVRNGGRGGGGGGGGAGDAKIATPLLDIKKRDPDTHPSPSSSSSSAIPPSRSTMSRSRSTSLANGYASESQGRGNWNEVDLPAGSGDGKGPGKKPPVGDRIRAVAAEMKKSVRIVGAVVGTWYFWLLWNS